MNYWICEILQKNAVAPTAVMYDYECCAESVITEL